MWVIPLDDLTVNDPLVIASDWWFADEVEQSLDPFITPLQLEIQAYGVPAELVKYRVVDCMYTDMVVILSEAILEYGPSATDRTTWGRIKGMYR